MPYAIAEASTTTTMLLFTPSPRRRRGCAARPEEGEPVLHEQLAAEHREQDHPLHHADEARREVGALQRVAGVLQPSEQERDEHDGERVVAGERRDDDARVAVVRLLQAARVEHVAEVAVIWLAPPIPAIAPDRHMIATIFRRVRMPAYRAARGESPITCASKPNRVRA